MSSLPLEGNPHTRPHQEVDGRKKEEKMHGLPTGIAKGGGWEGDQFNTSVSWLDMQLSLRQLRVLECAYVIREARAPGAHPWRSAGAATHINLD